MRSIPARSGPAGRSRWAARAREAATALVALAAVGLSASLALPAGAQAQTTAPDQSTSTSSSPPVTAAPAADLRLSGSVEEGPPAQGIATGDTMRHRISIRNQGPEPVPPGGLLLVLSVGRDDGGLATLEVAGFDDDGSLRSAQGGACGIGTRAVLQCTNRQQLEPGAEIGLVVAHRHPAPEPGSLSFVAESSIVSAGISDPDPGNNTYRGPGYRFTIQPSTTTTSSTMPPSSSTTDPSTPTSDASSSSTSTTLATTTITSAPATTVATTTTMPTTTTVLQAMSDDSASLVVSRPTLAGASGPADEAGEDQELLLATAAQDPGDGDGPPVVLLGALGAVVLLAGGVALALYLRLSQEPPLVDIRRFD